MSIRRGRRPRAWGGKKKRYTASDDYPQMSLEDRGYCDLAHIIDKADGGKLTGANVVQLCPNDHRLFDQGLLTEAELRTLKSSMESFGYNTPLSRLRKAR